MNSLRVLNLVFSTEATYLFNWNESTYLFRNLFLGIKKIRATIFKPYQFICTF